MDIRAWREKLRRFWHTDDPRKASIRDLLVAVGVLGILLVGLWTYAGQPFPSEAPLVVVESGSMMHGSRSPHPYGSPGFSRVGTIDPGDLVIVKDIDEASDVETAFGSGRRSGYGGHGDVIVYRTGGTPIIHRAMLYIEAVPEGCKPNDPLEGCAYRIPETCGDGFGAFVKAGDADWSQYCEGSSDPITLSLERDGLTLSISNYPCQNVCDPFYSGFFTKGDNNPQQDQAPTHSLQGQSKSRLIRVEDIVGKARGEIPWFGLVKLALFGNPNYREGSDPTGAEQWKILNARAPWDIWVALFIAIGLLLALPPALEFGVRKFRERRDRDKQA